MLDVFSSFALDDRANNFLDLGQFTASARFFVGAAGAGACRIDRTRCDPTSESSPACAAG
jgi:hypothetical protein